MIKPVINKIVTLKGIVHAQIKAVLCTTFQRELYKCLSVHKTNYGGIFIFSFIDFLFLLPVKIWANHC